MNGYLVLVKRFEDRAKAYSANVVGMALSPESAKALFVNTERVIGIDWVEASPGEVWRTYYTKPDNGQKREFAAYILKTPIQR